MKLAKHEANSNHCSKDFMVDMRRGDLLHAKAFLQSHILQEETASRSSTMRFVNNEMTSWGVKSFSCGGVRLREKVYC